MSEGCAVASMLGMLEEREAVARVSWARRDARILDVFGRSDNAARPQGLLGGVVDLVRWSGLVVRPQESTLVSLRTALEEWARQTLYRWQAGAS
ncbi:hypothetical protein [Streptomyces sp. NPDC056323]|uniref:hypothetical protein n=1 Tax=unclassified Streptomyces TaxID=2593676 RepID=UPI0035DD8A08